MSCYVLPIILCISGHSNSADSCYGVRRGNLYYLDLTESGEQQILGQVNQVNGVENAKDTVWLWHRILGHLSFGYLKKLQPHLFSIVSESDFHCDICELAKSHRISYSPSLNKSPIPFMKVHSDVWGPAKISSLSEVRYFVSSPSSTVSPF